MIATGLFSRLRTTPCSKVRRIVTTVLLAMVGGFALCGSLGVRINASPSLPIGLYVTSTSPAANLIEFCPAEPFAALAIARGYRDTGNCPDGAAPLLKPVFARAGDVVEVSSGGMSVNGHPLPNTAPLRSDTKGRLLTPWPQGRYVVETGTIWVASSYNPRSFDSRYFGPVSLRSVRNHVRPWVTLR